MVGVPGRSQGCLTCRKRKVKCDQGRPACGQCQKGNRECGGYEPYRCFKNFSILDRNTLLARQQPIQPINSGPASHGYGLVDEARPPKRRRHDDDNMVIYSPSIPQSNHVPIGRVPSLKRMDVPEPGDDGLLHPKRLKENHISIVSPMQETPAIPQAEMQEEKQTRQISNHDSTPLMELFNMFLSEVYAPQRSPSGCPDLKSSWLSLIPELQGKHPSLDLAIKALIMVRLARKSNDARMSAEGMRNYGKALGQIQKMVASEETVFEESTLASCMALSIFEILEITGDNVSAWVSHIEGLANLFQLRGPERHIDGNSHRMFLGFRLTGIIHSLAIRQPTYLGHHSWLTIPWTMAPKTDLHHLLDIMTQIPSLMQETDSSLSGISSISPVLLLEQNREFERRLHTWYNSYSTAAPSPPFIAQPASIFISTMEGRIQPPTDTCLEFPDFETARICVFYWAALLLVRNDLNNLLKSLGSTSAWPDGNLDKEIRETATRILEAIPYLLRLSAHILGPQNVFFPLRVAMHSYVQLQNSGAEDERGKHGKTIGAEEQYCRVVLEELATRGFPFGKILADLSWDEIPAFFTGGQKA